MLREETTDNGQFNVTEFGSVKDEDQFKALYAYSPYHHVKDGTQYPAVLFTAGDNDGRVAPWNSRKMTARLQASGTKRPVLLRTSATSGHGIGDSLDESIAEQADIYAFLFWQLGMSVSG
jgi:prolyl oligopeptidase